MMLKRVCGKCFQSINHLLRPEEKDGYIKCTGVTEKGPCNTIIGIRMNGIASGMTVKLKDDKAEYLERRSDNPKHRTMDKKPT